MAKYAFSYDDGAHTNRIEEFTSLEEAQKYYDKEVQKAMEDPEKYFDQSKEDWTEDFYPHIELHTIDEDDLYDEEIDSWAPLLEEE